MGCGSAEPWQAPRYAWPSNSAGDGYDQRLGRLASKFKTNRFTAIGALGLTNVVEWPLFGCSVGQEQLQGSPPDSDCDVMASGRTAIEIMRCPIGGHRG